MLVELLFVKFGYFFCFVFPSGWYCRCYWHYYCTSWLVRCILYCILYFNDFTINKWIDSPAHRGKRHLRSVSSRDDLAIWGSWSEWRALGADVDLVRPTIVSVRHRWFYYSRFQAVSPAAHCASVADSAVKCRQMSRQDQISAAFNPRRLHHARLVDL